MANKRRHGRGRLRLEQNGCVLSEILAHPGPTHSIFDVLAAAVHVFSPGPRVAVLGFAGGGMMAPLRKLGGEHEVHGVDLAEEGFALYREVTGDPGNQVQFEKEDAVTWLRRQRGKLDAIVEDLSVPVPGDVVKPAVSWEVLPDLIGKKTKARGVAVANLLPTPGMSWNDLLAPYQTGPGVVVEFSGYWNRIVIQGSEIGDARCAGRKLRNALDELGSEMVEGLAVRRLGDQDYSPLTFTSGASASSLRKPYMGRRR